MKDYKRDDTTQALVNNDFDGLKSYKNKRERIKKIEKLSEEINIITSELTVIKNLIQKIIERG